MVQIHGVRAKGIRCSAQEGLYQFRADTAVTLIHSFSSENIGLQDHREFAALFGADAGVGQVVHVATVGGIALHLAWVRDSLSSSVISK